VVQSVPARVDLDRPAELVDEDVGVDQRSATARLVSSGHGCGGISVEHLGQGGRGVNILAEVLLKGERNQSSKCDAAAILDAGTHRGDVVHTVPVA
jgi:hypothetical protein